MCLCGIGYPTDGVQPTQQLRHQHQLFEPPTTDSKDEMTDFQQQLAAGAGLCNAESLKVFGQMYAQPYGNGFLKDDKAQIPYNPMIPFFQHFAPYSTTGTSSFSPTSTSSTSSNSSAHHQSVKKKPVPVPAEQKDETYFERRRRNNEAARKSREMRRKQDMDNEARVRQLVDENTWLKTCINQLTAENATMKQQIYMQASTFAATDTTAIIPPFN